MRGVPDDLPYVYLHPGEMHFGKAPTVVGTVLGSCLAVSFFSRRLAAGAICHALLPYGQSGKGCRYVDGAIRHMLDEFARLRVAPHELDAKLFGGADMFGPADQDPAHPTVGRPNIAAAQAVLAREGVTLSNASLGGNQGRKLFFYTHTGEVLLKHIERPHFPEGVR